MKFIALVSVAIFLFLESAGLSASDQPSLTDVPFQLDVPNGLQSEQVSALEKFIFDANAILPRKLKAAFKSRIRVKFVNMGGAIPIEVDCNRTKSVELGRVPSGANNHIFLNQNLIPEILKGPDGSRKINCGHGNYYRTALASLLHEGVHILDTDGHFSRQENYLFVTGWSSNGLRRNHLSNRSPDAYEFANPAEGLAVNMEYLLLDPEFRCRRPTVYKHLIAKFQIESDENQVHCEPFKSVFVTGERKPVTLDSKRIYEVQYLLAEPGSELSSHWGHSMIRLVVCDPKRAEVGPECSSDTSHHLIVSYRAGADDFKLSKWKSLTGKYPSQLHLLRLDSLLEDYGRIELRNLKSFPLKLDADQKENVIDYLREQFWTYEGKYFFLSNNCSTEIKNAIRAAYQDRQLALSSGMFGVMTPIGLENILQKADLIDVSVQNDRNLAIEKGYLFPTKHRNDLRTAFEAARTLYGEKYKTLDEFLAKSTAKERHELLRSQEIRLQGNSQLTSSLLILELQHDRLNSKAIGKLIAQLGESKPEAFAPFKDVLHAIPQRAWLKKDARYGVPSQEEIDPCFIDRLGERFRSLNNEIYGLLQLAYPSLQEETQIIEGNLEYLMKVLHLLQSAAAPIGL